MDILSGSLQMLFYILETALQTDIFVKFYNLEKDESGGKINILITGLILLLSTQVLVNIISIVLVYRNMIFTTDKDMDKNKSCVIFVVMHVLQLGLVWRYFKLVITKDKDDLKELTILRVLQSSIQSIIFITILAHFMFSDSFHNSSSYAVLSFVTLAISITSLSLSLSILENNWSFKVMKTLPTKLNHTKEGKEIYVKNNWCCLVLVILSKILMLTSRCLSVLLLTSLIKLWIILVIVCHTLIYSSIVYVLRSLSKDIVGTNPKDFVYNLIHLTDFIRIYSKITPLEIIAFFVLQIVENVTCAFLWYFKTTFEENREIFIVLIITSILLGVLILLLKNAYRYNYQLSNVIKGRCMLSLDLCSIERPISQEECSQWEKNAENNVTTTENKGNIVQNVRNPGICLQQIDILSEITDKPVDCAREVIQASVEYVPQTTMQPTHTVNDTATDDYGNHILSKNKSLNSNHSLSSSGVGSELENSEIVINSHQFPKNRNIVGNDSGCCGSSFENVNDRNEDLNASCSTTSRGCIYNHSPLAKLSFSLVNGSNNASACSTSTSVEFLELDLDPIYYLKDADTISLDNCMLIQPTCAKYKARQKHSTPGNKQKNNAASVRIGKRTKQSKLFTKGSQCILSGYGRRRHTNVTQSYSVPSESSVSSYHNVQRRKCRNKPRNNINNITNLPHEINKSYLASDEYSSQSSESETASSYTSNSYTTDTFDLLGSDDSVDDFTMSWPPARRITIENLKDLPTERVNPMDNVVNWLDTVTMVPFENDFHCQQKKELQNFNHQTINCECVGDLNSLFGRKKHRNCTCTNTGPEAVDYSTSNELIKRSLYNYHRFGSPVPWSSSKTQNKYNLKANSNIFTRLCCVNSKPQNLWPYNTSGKLSKATKPVVTVSSVASKSTC